MAKLDPAEVQNAESVRQDAIGFGQALGLDNPRGAASSGPESRVAQGSTLASLAAPRGTPLVEQFAPTRAQIRNTPPADAPKGSIWQAAWEREGTIPALGDIIQSAGFSIDPSWEFPAEDSDLWKEATADLPAEYWTGLGSAVSRDHFAFLVQKARKEFEAEQLLEAHGAAGVGARVAVALGDPVGLAIGVATAGLGYASKGTRVAKAVKIGLVAGAENAAIESLIAANSAARDGHDVAYAGLAGLVLGGALGGLLSKSDAVRAADLGNREAARLAAAEAAEATGGKPVALDLARARAQHSEALTRIERAVDSELDARERELQELLDSREGIAVAVRGPETGTLADKMADAQAELDRLTKLLHADEAGQVERLFRKIHTPRAERETVQGLILDLGNTRARRDVPADAARKEAAAQVAAERRDLFDRAVTARSLVARYAQDLERAEKIGRARGDLDLLRASRQGADFETKLSLLGDEGAKAVRKAVRRADKALDEATTAAAPKAPLKVEPIEAHVDRSGGAASAGMGDTPELRPVPERDPTAMTRFQKLRYDLASTLRGTNEAVAALVGRYVGDSVGAVDGQVTATGASEFASRTQERLLAKFYTALTPAYETWRKANSIGAIAKWKRTNRSEFNTMVTRAIRGENILEKEAVQAAAEVRKVFAEVLEEAKAAGVKGFEDVATKGTYVPRVFNTHAIDKFLKEFTSDQMEQMVRGAMRANVPEDVVDDVVLGVIAKGYVRRLRELGLGLDTRMTNGLNLRDTEALAGMLRDAKVDEGTIGDVVARLKAMAAKSDTGEGSVRYAKFRVDLDENFGMYLKSKEDGVERMVRLDELFENDIEHLMGRYLRSMSGHIGMAKIGVRSYADHQKNLEGLASVLEGERETLAKVREAADMAYKLVTGQPIENLQTVARWSRFIRDYNFTRTMNQSGFAQIPDLAGLLSSAYFKHTLRYIPEIGQMMKRGADGKLVDEYAQELEELLGVGTDYHNVAVFSMFDLEADGFKGFLGSVEHGLRVMGRGTQAMSGMAFITSAAQRLTAKAIVQRFVDHALKGGKAFPTERLAALGIDDSMMTRIKAQIEKNVEFIDGDSGKKIRQLGYAKWDDLDARDAFLQAVHKEARRLVQEEDVGDTAAWMHKSIAKVILQFRRFAIVSYTKQLLNGIAHPDAESATRLLMSMTLAGSAYVAQQRVRMIGMDEERKREHAETWLSLQKIGAAAYARSSYASLTPAIADSILGTLFGIKAFDVRVSGQASSLINGISTVDAANKLKQVLSKSAQMVTRGDRQFTESDLSALKALLPYQNLVPMNMLFESLIKPGLDLPQKQTDADPDDAEFRWE